MNPVLILAHNNLELTKKTIASVQAQHVPTFIFVVDNDSTDGTTEWLRGMIDELNYMQFSPQLGVSAGWNAGLNLIFADYNHCLVLNNDVVLPPWFYGELLAYKGVPFVTGVAIDTMPTDCPPEMPLTANPDFSAFLIRRSAWEAIGEFDERMKFYASDCDYHVRGHRLGIPMMKANVPYFHLGSSTLNLASPEEQTAIRQQADADRKVFRDLYGCVPGEAAYDALFSDSSVGKVHGD